MIKYMVTAIILAFTTPAMSSVVFNEETKSLEISGMTTLQQAIEVFQIMKDNVVLTVIIHGNGGDYNAGTTIGRMIREEGSTVIVPDGKRAVSAAALAALGGENIIIDGELWFHAPYMIVVPTGVTILDITQKFGEVYIDMVGYLAQMDIPISFSIDILVRTAVDRFIVIDDEAEIVSMRATETLLTKAVYQYSMKSQMITPPPFTRGF